MLEGSREGRSLARLLPIGNCGGGEEMEDRIIRRRYRSSQARLPGTLLVEVGEELGLLEQAIRERHRTTPTRVL